MTHIGIQLFYDWIIPAPFAAIWLALLPAMIACLKEHQDRVSILIIIIGVAIIDIMTLFSPANTMAGFYLDLVDSIIEQIRVMIAMVLSCTLWGIAFAWSCIGSQTGGEPCSKTLQHTSAS